MQSWTDLRLAIKQRDVRSVINIMFDDSEPVLTHGFRTENELWDFKKDCPQPGKANIGAWADLAKEVLGMHNAEGGVLFFGISDDYKFVGTRTRLDSKLLNDGLRKFVGDRLWVDFNREFIQPDQTYLGIALIPPRGAGLKRFVADAPEANGARLFRAGWSAIRRGDSVFVLTPQEADHLDRTVATPVLGRAYAVDEPMFRVLQPDYSSFVAREEPYRQVEEALRDQRVAVVSIVGIGGIGKTALATYAVLQAFEKRQFQYIVSITAKDRELTSTGILSLQPSLTSFDALLDNTLDVLGFAELKTLPIDDKEKEVASLLKGTQGLLYVDNLETVDDARVIQFLDKLPEGPRAIITSRRTTVRNLVRPVDLGGLNDKEVQAYIRSLSNERGLHYISNLRDAERSRIGDSCDRIPLAIRWVLARSKTAADAVANAESLVVSPKRGEELLEFSFRRVFDSMPQDEKVTLEVLALFQQPLASEALLVGSQLTSLRLEDALDSLSRDALVKRQFDPNRNDYVFTIQPITRSFIFSELNKRQAEANLMRKRLADWYEARDERDPTRRLTLRNLRQGTGSPEESLLALAHAAERDGDLDNAEALFEQAISRSPKSWRAARELAEFYRHRRRDITRALAMYERAAANAPRQGSERALIFREYGFLLRDSGEANSTDKALDCFETAYSESPNDPLVIYGMAQVLERKGNFERVISLLESLIGHPNPTTRKKCLPLLGKAYKRTGQILKATEVQRMIDEDAF